MNFFDLNMHATNILTLIGLYFIAKTTLIYCDVLNIHPQTMNKVLHWFKSDPPHGIYDLTLGNMMFSQYFICVFLKEILTIYFLGKKYSNVGWRHQFLSVTMLYKEFIIHSTINRFIYFLKMCDQKYNNHHYTYGKNGHRVIVPSFYE